MTVGKELECVTQKGSINITIHPRKMPNQKAPGADGLHEFRLKKFTSLHQATVKHLDDCIQAGLSVTIIFNTETGYSSVQGKERLNHLLFIDDLKLYGSNDNKIDSLVKVVKIVSGDIGMPFGFGKYAVLKMKRGKQVHCEGIDLGDGVVMEEADE